MSVSNNHERIRMAPSNLKGQGNTAAINLQVIDFRYQFIRRPRRQRPMSLFGPSPTYCDVFDLVAIGWKADLTRTGLDRLKVNNPKAPAEMHEAEERQHVLSGAVSSRLERAVQA